MRVLFVEDSAGLRDTVTAALRRSGYAVDTAGDGEAGLTLATSLPYDVAVLDIMLPKLDGLELLQRMRAAGTAVPVLMLTARSSVADRVAGLNRGADDYLAKPFALEELLARVQALGRRRYGQSVPQIVVGPLVVDTVAKRIACAGRPVDLAPREYALLEYLAFRRGVVVSRSEIEEHIYDDLVDPMSNVVDSAICLLRRRLGAAGAPSLIHTRRGLGYCLTEPQPCPPCSAS
jgi:DNA-binding response OmpR family regulator